MQDKKIALKMLHALQKEFDITSEINNFIDLQIDRYQDGTISLHQQNYANKVRERFSMDNANPVLLTLDANTEKNSTFKKENEKPIRMPYREAIGSLICH